MDYLFIFGAKYLFLLSPILAGLYFIRVQRETRREILIVSILTVVLAWALSILLGALFYSPQPFVVENFAPLISQEVENGFPSHHTLLVATVASVFTLWSRRLTYGLWGITLLVGLSRIYVGVHQPIDILGSIAIASISTLLVYYTRRAILRSIKTKSTDNEQR